jgi:hypothetical protein
MLEIKSELIEFNECLAVSAVTINQENCNVTVYSSGLALESTRYVELAQARAMVLAQQIIENGVQSVQPEAFIINPGSVASQSVAKKVVYSSPSPIAAATDEVITSDPKSASEAESSPPLSRPDTDVHSSIPPSPPAEPATAVDEDAEIPPDIPW